MTERAARWYPDAFMSRVFGIRRHEAIAVAWSFAYFFCLLAAYYMLRSVRDAMAIVSGVENIPWLFTGTFTVMLLAAPVFGWVASHFARKVFIPWVYYFFVLNIAGFYAAFNAAEAAGTEPVWVARSFFVWLSVFNLFVVSVFWSFMADIYTREQSRRLFGFISAGGSTGALLGPVVTSAVVVPIGFENLLPLSALLLLFAAFCVHRLRAWTSRFESGERREAAVSDRPMGGSALAGIRFVLTSPYFSAIALALLLSNFMGVTIYMYLVELVGRTFETTDRQTQVFAMLDAIQNALSFVGQLLVVRYSVQRLGIGTTLAIMPLVSIAGFALLALNPSFVILAGLQVLRRSIGFGLSKPTSDMLYAVVTPEARYKAKNFIETAVYRGADLAGTWTVRALSGLGLGGIALLCIPLAAAWTGLALWIGRQYNRQDTSDEPEAAAA